MVLLYLLYGSDHNMHQQLRYSLATAIYFRDQLTTNSQKFEIVVLTEQPELFSNIPVQTLLLSKSNIREWSLNGVFPLRIKLFALQYILELYGEKIIFVDTDTFFTNSPIHIFKLVTPQTSVLHELEEDATPASLAAWETIYKTVSAGEIVDDVEIDLTQPMYNSGVIGIHHDNKYLLAKSISVLDYFLNVNSTIHTLEQYSLSLTLNKFTHIRTCKQHLVHYWPNKEIYTHLVKTKLAKYTHDEVLDIHSIGTNELCPPTLNILTRVYLKLLTISGIDSAEFVIAKRLHKLSLVAARYDIELANLMSQQLLNYLITNKLRFNTQRQKILFNSLLKHHARGSLWSDPDSKQKWLQYLKSDTNT